jgi:hypothetical protein
MSARIYALPVAPQTPTRTAPCPLERAGRPTTPAPGTPAGRMTASGQPLRVIRTIVPLRRPL